MAKADNCTSTEAVILLVLLDIRDLLQNTSKEEVCSICGKSGEHLLLCDRFLPPPQKEENEVVYNHNGDAEGYREAGTEKKEKLNVKALLEEYAACWVNGFKKRMSEIESLLTRGNQTTV